MYTCITPKTQYRLCSLGFQIQGGLKKGVVGIVLENYTTKTVLFTLILKLIQPFLQKLVKVSLIGCCTFKDCAVAETEIYKNL